MNEKLGVENGERRERAREREREREEKDREDMAETAIAWTLICCAARACFNNSCTVERSYMATNVRNDHFCFTFCRFGSVVGQSWPQDPFKRVRLEK